MANEAAVKKPPWKKQSGSRKTHECADNAEFHHSVGSISRSK